MRRLNGTVDGEQKLATNGVKIDCIAQPHVERGDDGFGVVAGTVEPPIHETLPITTAPPPISHFNCWRGSPVACR